MSTKPPFGWASGGRSEESDSANAASNSGDPVSDGQTEILVDASDDVTVEASEDITSQAKGNASDCLPTKHNGKQPQTSIARNLPVTR